MRQPEGDKGRVFEREQRAVTTMTKGEMHIPLVEEDLVASTRSIAGGAVRVTKRVVSVDRVHDLPATDEQIRVEQRIVERLGETGAMQAFAQILIEIPLDDDVAAGLQTGRLTEELIVTREIVQRTERITETVRREDVAVDGELIAGDGWEEPARVG